MRFFPLKIKKNSPEFATIFHYFPVCSLRVSLTVIQRLLLAMFTLDFIDEIAFGFDAVNEPVVPGIIEKP